MKNNGLLRLFSAACVIAVSVFYPANVVSADMPDSAREVFEAMQSTGGAGYSCRWSLLVDVDGKDAYGQDAVVVATVAVGVSDVRFVDSKTLIVEDFWGDYDLTIVDTGDSDPIFKLDNMTGKREKANKAGAVYNILSTAISKETQSITKQQQTRINLFKKGESFVVDPEIVSGGVWDTADDGHAFVDFTASGCYLLYADARSASIIETQFAPGTAVYFNRLRLDFDTAGNTVLANAGKSLSSIPGSNTGWHDAVARLVDTDRIEAGNLYGLGVSMSGNCWDIRANGYPTMTESPFVIISDGNQASLSINGETMLRGIIQTDIIRSDDNSSQNSYKFMQFTTGGNYFAYTAYIPVVDSEIPTDIYANTKSGPIRTATQAFYDKVHGGQLSPVCGTIVRVPNPSPANSHWVRGTVDMVRRITFDSHSLVPVRIIDSNRYENDKASGDFYIQDIWEVGEPIAVSDLELMIPDGTDDFGGNDGVTFDLNVYGDDRSKPEQDRTVVVSGQLTAPAGEAALYVCRGDIDDYTAAYLGDTLNGHRYGLQIYSGTSADGVYDISTAFEMSQLPDNPLIAPSDHLTLYARYTVQPEDAATLTTTADNSDTPRYRFGVVATLNPSDITTDVPDITMTHPANAAYTLAGRTITAGTPLRITDTTGRTITTLITGQHTSLAPGLYLATPTSNPTSTPAKLLIR